MKKILVGIILLILFIGIIGCSNQKELKDVTVKEQSKISVKQDIRQIAWKQLTTKDKKRIVGTWKCGKVFKRTLNKNMGFISDKSYINKEIYIIDFPTKLNNYIVFFTLDSYKVIGYGYVD